MYCPGKEMYIADMLSQAYLKETASKITSEYQIFNLSQENKLYKEIQDIDPAEHVRVSEGGLVKIRAATEQDAMLQELAATIHQGWPESKTDAPLTIRAYWPFRDELTEHDKLIYKDKNNYPQKLTGRNEAKDTPQPSGSRCISPPCKGCYILARYGK